MSSLRKEVSFWADELRDGIVSVVFWKTGRSWHCDKFCPIEGSDTFDDDDRKTLREIYEEDHNAILVDYDNSAIEQEDTVDFMVDRIRYLYETSTPGSLEYLAYPERLVANS